MATGTVYITTQGETLAAKTLQSKTLEFSKFEIGSGTLTDTSADTIKALTSLVNPIINFNITKVARETDTQVTVRGIFKNTDASESFYLRELGLYAIDPDTNEEILFAYVNYGDEAEYINNSNAQKKEHYYDMIISVDNADNVTITDTSTVYVTEKDLEEKADELIADYDNKISNLKTIVVASNAGAHNAIYRGEDITELFYDGTLTKQIAAGTFDDIFIGDYIVGKNSNKKYLVADLDYRLYTGKTETTKHHVLMIPEASMGYAKMNTSAVTDGGYINSEMYTSNLDEYKTVINSDFGSEHILKHQNAFCYYTEDGHEQSIDWHNSTVDLMSEIMVYGRNIFRNRFDVTNLPMDYTIDKTQLSLFRLNPSQIMGASNRSTYWLRDVVSSSRFAKVYFHGYASYDYASNSGGVRPAFLVY